jgi:hypothetical protein
MNALILSCCFQISHKLNIKCDRLNYNLGVINDMNHYCVEASFGFVFGLPTFQECDHG